MSARCEQIHPLTGEPRHRNGHARPNLFTLGARPVRGRPIDATYDAARDSDEFSLKRR